MKKFILLFAYSVPRDEEYTVENMLDKHSIPVDIPVSDLSEKEVKNGL